jgi:hypothetical protein
VIETVDDPEPNPWFLYNNDPTVVKMRVVIPGFVAGYRQRNMFEIIDQRTSKVTVLTDYLAEDFCLMTQIWEEHVPTQAQVEAFLDGYSGLCIYPGVPTA